MSPANEYIRILERDPQDISSLWRIFQLFFYFVAATAGYLGTIYFYTLWQDIFDGQCPLWSSVGPMPRNQLEPPNGFGDEDDTFDIEVSNVTDWRLDVVVSKVYNPYCNTFFIVMISSCAFGVIWLMFFYLCSKGGYDGEIMGDSSRIVIAAFFFSLLFSIFAFYTAHNISDGLAQFSAELERVYFQLTNTTMPQSYYDKCTVIQTYINAYKGNRFDVCKTFMYTKILVWVMCTSWTAGMILLLVRILTLTDFRFVKVTVYNVPREDSPSTSNGEDKQKNI